MVSYILRECFITSAMHLLLMSCGITITLASVLAQGLTAEQAHFSVTEDQLNLVMQVYFLSSPLGFLIFPWTMQRYGRKVTNVLFNLCVITGSIFIAVASSATFLIIGRAFHGLSLAAYYIGCSIAAEYTHPRRRGVQIIMKGVSGSIGELLCSSLGLTVLSYHQAALLSVVPAVLSIAITLKWPESPQYLAYKGRYDECTAAFQWMRGIDAEAKNELQELIRSQREREKHTEHIFARCGAVIRSKGFWMPMFLIFFSNVYFNATGLLFMVSSPTLILNMTTGDQYTSFLFTVLLSVFRIFCNIVSSLIVRVVKRRSLLFSSGAAAFIVLITFCVLHYFNKVGTTDLKLVAVSLFIAYYVLVNVAIAPITMIIQGELLPLKYKGVGTFLAGMVIDLSAVALMTTTWNLITVVDINGIFAIHLIASAICYVMLLIFLPETKDKTLQDIEKYFFKEHLRYNSVTCNVGDKLAANESLVKQKCVI